MEKITERPRIIRHLEEIAREVKISDEDSKGGIIYLGYHYIRTSVKDSEIPYYQKKFGIQIQQSE